MRYLQVVAAIALVLVSSFSVLSQPVSVSAQDGEHHRPPTVTVPSGSGSPKLSDTLPAGFVEEVVANGLNYPVDSAFLPDGRILIAEKSGIVRIVKNGALLPTPFINISSQVNDYWDRGLLSIVVDPQFTANGFVYLLFTYEHDSSDYSGTKTGRLIRVVASGDTATPATQVVILGSVNGDSCNNFPAGTDCIPSDGPSHSIGGMDFDSAGNLYVTLGDGADWRVVTPDALRSQDLDSLAGKIVRISRDGQAVAGNPFHDGDANSIRSKVWGYGLRNGYRLQIRPDNDIPYVGDVGWIFWEEINVAYGGVNMGWPCYEGAAIHAGYENLPICQDLISQGPDVIQHALVSWDHNTGTAAATGGDFLTSADWPAAYQGAYFYGDYVKGWINYLKVDASDNLVGGPFTFIDHANGPVSIEFGPDGNLYYVSIETGELRLISYGSLPGNPETIYLSDLQPVFATNGWGPYEVDQSNGEQASGDGQQITINGETFVKGLGVHALSELVYDIPAGCLNFDSTVGVDDEMTFNSSIIFNVQVDSADVFTSGVHTATSAGETLSVNVVGGSQLTLNVGDAGNGVGSDHGDWADARFICNIDDSTPPQVSDVNPADGATNINTGADVSATFNEPMDAFSVVANLDLVELGTLNPVAGSITYDPATRTVTLQTDSSLSHSTTYIATVGAGAQDLAGNALANQFSWSFTTMSDSGGVNTIYLSDIAWDAAISGWGPVERDMSNGEQPPGDGGPLTIRGQSYPKGLGVHAYSSVTFSIDTTCSMFQAVVGVDDETGGEGSVAFEVWVDGTKRYDSGTLTGVSLPQPVQVDLGGNSTLQLIVNIGGDHDGWDHADWADAKLTCGEDNAGPIITSISPVAGETSVALDTVISAMFNEELDPASIAGNVSLSELAGNAVTVNSAYDSGSGVLTITPTADLEAGTTYQVTITGGAGGVSDIDGNPMLDDFSWAFTTMAEPMDPVAIIDSPSPDLLFKVGDEIAFTGHALDYQGNPLPDSALEWRVIIQHCNAFDCHAHQVLTQNGVPNGSFTVPDHGEDYFFQIELTAVDGAGSDVTVVEIHPQTVTVTVETTPAGLDIVLNGESAPSPITRVMVANSNANLLAPSPQGLYEFVDWDHGGSQQHDVNIGSGSSVTYVANYEASSAGEVLYLSDLTWIQMTNGWGPAERDQSNGEQAASDGQTLTINGVSFQKGLGVHAVSELVYDIPALCTTFESAIGVDDEMTFNSSVIFTVLVDGITRYNSGVLTFASGHEIVSVDIYGGSQITLRVDGAGDGIGSDHADWADARFICPGEDTIAPQVSSVDPFNGATGVDVDAPVSAIFSEPMDESSVIANVEMVPQGVATPVAVAVSYDFPTRTVTIQPDSNLAFGTTYVVTVDTGVTDLAGNPLPASYSWSFTTQPDGGASDIVYLSDLSWDSAVSGWGPVERDMSNGEQPAGDGELLTIRGTSYPKGLGVHSYSEIKFTIDSVCREFHAVVGVDDETGGEGSVGFEVWVDGIQRFASGTLTGASSPLPISVGLNDNTELTLIVNDGGDHDGWDHADWADARLLCGDDLIAPAVTGILPDDSAANIPTNTAMTATFSEPMDSTSVIDSISIIDSATGLPVAANATWDETTWTVTLIPDNDLEFGASYSVVISTAAADIAGNTLAAEMTRVFTTISSSLDQLSFAAAGDLGGNALSAASLQALADSDAEMFFALGDLNYSDILPESDWCAFVKSYVGEAFPFQLLAGNHEDDFGGDWFILNYAACLPDRLNVVGGYPTEYYVDFGDLARIILISPDLTVDGIYYDYSAGTARHQWLSEMIHEAQILGFPWVIVGMHKVCISAGDKSCEIGADLMDMLIDQRVDLVLQAHAHSYQRSEQLTCLTPNVYLPQCVTEANPDGSYSIGAGTVIVISGAFGGTDLRAIDVNDPEYNYLVASMGSNSLLPGRGFVHYQLTQTMLLADFVGSTSAFQDTFSILQ